ncbi:MAG: carbohydrate kinase [Sphingobacteriaceae bacterium]|nr:carbohydrate kinase [Cytophagaceae bacterium]
MINADLTSLFARFTPLRVGIIGDFAVDFYYQVQEQTGEFSLETGREVHWASRPRTAPGGAGNVVQNLAALGIGTLRVFGCTGQDVFGRELRHLLASLGVDTTALLDVPGWDTCTYTKPFEPAGESLRIDFGTHNALAEVVFTDLLDRLHQALPDLDVLVVNQQFPNPLLDAARIGALNSTLARFSTCRVVADLRDFGRLVRGATLKVNTAELARLLDTTANDDLDWCLRHGSLLHNLIGGPVVITRGERGLVYVGEPDVYIETGLPLGGSLDPVGAGDTVVAALAACLGAGALPAEALQVANLAAAVTVQKIGQTGTASLEEVLALNSNQ